MAAEIEIIRGDDKTIPISFSDGNTGSPIDITNYTLFFTVKQSVTDSDDDAAIAKEITDHTAPTLGSSVIILSNTDTAIDAGLYLYDIQVKDMVGSITTPNQYPASFIVKSDITQRTS